MSRLEGAIRAVRQAVATAANLPPHSIERDDDLRTDLCLDELERVSVGLILEEVFAITVPDDLWDSPLYRTPAALAEWCIRKSEEAAWAQTQQRGHRA